MTSSFLDSFPRMSWPSSHTLMFETSSVFNNGNGLFINDVEMEDVSDEEAMDYEITPMPNEDPVAQVHQVEEDEKLAISLQAQYDAEAHITVYHLNGREQHNPSSSSRRSQSLIVEQYQLLQEQLQIIDLLLRTWTPFFPDDDYESLLHLSVEIGDHPSGLNPHEINALPTRKFSSGKSKRNVSHGMNSEDSEECTICLCEYKYRDLLRILPCCHEFHTECVDKWLNLHNTCPVCRAEISRQQFETKRK